MIHVLLKKSIFIQHYLQTNCVILKNLPIFYQFEPIVFWIFNAFWNYIIFCQSKIVFKQLVKTSRFLQTMNISNLVIVVLGRIFNYICYNYEIIYFVKNVPKWMKLCPFYCNIKIFNCVKMEMSLSTWNSETKIIVKTS